MSTEKQPPRPQYAARHNSDELEEDELPGCTANLRTFFGPGRMIHVAKYMPLIAAIIAPTSTLLDIPALSQKWYLYNGAPVADDVGCTLLSAFGLALNVGANILLIMRFSSTRKIWRRATSLSLLLWIAKTIVAVVNVSYYGTHGHHDPGYSKSEGFWSAVASVCMAGVISIALSIHYLFAFGRLQADDSEDLRLTGRKFMFSVTFFMFLIGIQGIAFNRMEHWSYFDAIYFSFQVALTVGYGDLAPSTPAGKVLVFVFSVLTISQLANEVSIIIEFVHTRSEQKRDEWRKGYSVAMHRQAIKRRPYATLIDEMSLIHQINLHQETMVQMYDLFWSGFTLASFWVIGATVFKYVEHWSYGNSLYMVMVLSLTIGFGDFTPKTAGGRVIFVVYALMAVPIVTNFAVQTVGGIMYTWSEHRFTRIQFEMERERDPEVFAPHAHFILKHHEEWDDVRDKLMEARSTAAEEYCNLAKIVPSKTFSRTNTMESPANSADTPAKRARMPFWPKAAWQSSRQSSAQPSPQPSPSYAPTTIGQQPARPPSRAEEEVIGEMLDAPDTHDDVVAALGAPEVVPEEDTSGSSTTTRGGSPDRSKTIDDKIIDEDDTGYALKPDPARTRVDQLRRPSPTSRVTNVSPSAMSINSGGQGDSTPSMGPRLMHDGQEGDEYHVELTGDAMIDSHRIELHLIKELVDRVTRLEAQCRQMLIDCMDKDVARTLLLADRNLQIRDAFQLYGNGIDPGRAYQEEAEQTRADNAQRKREKELLHEQAAVIDDQTGSDDDMLSRVRRYRSTFAEVLVLSSTLLKLEGEDLKRFERWHVTQLPEPEDEHSPESHAGHHHEKVPRRMFAEGQLHRAVDYVSGKPTRQVRKASPEPKKPHFVHRLHRIGSLARHPARADKSFAEAHHLERGEPMLSVVGRAHSMDVPVEDPTDGGRANLGAKPPVKLHIRHKPGQPPRARPSLNVDTGQTTSPVLGASELVESPTDSPSASSPPRHERVADRVADATTTAGKDGKGGKISRKLSNIISPLRAQHGHGVLGYNTAEELQLAHEEMKRLAQTSGVRKDSLHSGEDHLRHHMREEARHRPTRHDHRALHAGLKDAKGEDKDRRGRGGPTAPKPGPSAPLQ